VPDQAQPETGARVLFRKASNSTDKESLGDQLPLS
jgi:hypothetical protein